MSVNVVIFTDYSARGFVRYAGAYTIATVLRKHGYTVQVIDHFLLAGPKRIHAAIDKFVGKETLFVGFSTTFMNLFGDYITASRENTDMFQFSNYSSVIDFCF